MSTEQNPVVIALQPSDQAGQLMKLAAGSLQGASNAIARLDGMLTAERTARQQAQAELARYKGLLASSRLDLMRELRAQGWRQGDQEMLRLVEMARVKIMAEPTSLLGWISKKDAIAHLNAAMSGEAPAPTWADLAPAEKAEFLQPTPTPPKPITREQACEMFKAWREGPLWWHMAQATMRALGVKP